MPTGRPSITAARGAPETESARYVKYVKYVNYVIYVTHLTRTQSDNCGERRRACASTHGCAGIMDAVLSPHQSPGGSLTLSDCCYTW